jgi:hypothetical protein
MVREHKFSPALPTVSQLNGEERLMVEEENVISSFDYSKTKLGLI